MSIKASIENTMSRLLNFALDTPYQTYEKFQDIRQKNPTYSVAMNILHNATPFAATFIAHSLSNMLPLPNLSYITSLAPWIATASCNGKSYLYRDQSKSIDSFIKYFDQLTTAKTLIHGYQHPSGFNPSEFDPTDTVSYYGCMYAIDCLTNLESRKLFNWHSITGEDRVPFENLQKALKTSPTSNTPEIKKAAQEVIAKLIVLKSTRAGILTDAYKTPDLHPRFKELSKALSTLNKELTINSTQDTTITQIKNLIELTSDAPSIFTQIIPNDEPKTPSSHFMTCLKNFKSLLEAFQKIPQSLKGCLFLKENREALQNKLNQLLQISPIPIALMPSSLQRATDDFSPLIQISDALIFYQDIQTPENQHQLHGHLEQLVNTITVLYGEDFKKHFLLEVGKKHRDSISPNILDTTYRTWAEKNLLKATIEDFDNTLKALAQKKGINVHQDRNALINGVFVL